MAPSLLALPASLGEPIIYVDCGARGELTNPLIETLSDSCYLGFEPDQEECARLIERVGSPRYRFFPVALGARQESRSFHLTRNPACSSVYKPDREFLDRFLEIGPFFDIVATRPVDTVTLDGYLSQRGIPYVDFVELDTQGAELDILRGAERFLATTVLGLQVEVEFTAMYHGQPLFADVDAYLRQFGFMLFDLSRYRLRRMTYQHYLETRGQLVWGHAFYLRNYRTLLDQNRKLCKLATLASYYGFHDYALEIAGCLTQQSALLGEEGESIMHAVRQYRSSLRNSRMLELLLKLDSTLLGIPMRWLGTIFAKIGAAFSLMRTRRNYFWKD